MITSGATKRSPAALMALDRAAKRKWCCSSDVRRLCAAGAAGRRRAALRQVGAAALALRREKLARAFTPRTGSCCSNNPLNPSATVFRREDLELLARYCEKFNAVAVCDEVWEHVMFDGRRHVPLIAMPGCASAASRSARREKIFSLTGWKVGFVAPRRICCACWPRRTSSSPPRRRRTCRPRSRYGLRQDDDYFAGMRADLQRSRDRFTSGLRTLGFPVIERSDLFRQFDLASLGLNEDDETFCKRLVLDTGCGDPVSAFYVSDPIRSVVRFCFAARCDARCRARRLGGALKRAA